MQVIILLMMFNNGTTEIGLARVYYHEPIVKCYAQYVGMRDDDETTKEYTCLKKEGGYVRFLVYGGYTA